MENPKISLGLVRGVAFDLEGTIVDIEDLHHSAHLQAAADLGINLSWEDALRLLPHFIGGPDEVVAAELAALAGENEVDRKFLSATRSYFNELLQKNSQNIISRDGVKEFIAWIKQQGLMIAIGTVTTRTLTLGLLEKSGLLGLFEQENIVTKEDVHALKPSPDVYFETARRMGIKPSSQLVFEDSITGLKSANSAGCYSVAIPTIGDSDFSKSLYEAGAKAVFYSWNDPDLRVFVSMRFGP